MRCAPKKSAGIVLVSAVILIAVVLGCERWSETDTLVRSDDPLARMDVSGKLSVQLPLTAKDIYFVEHSRGTQEYRCFFVLASIRGVWTKPSTS